MQVTDEMAEIVARIMADDLKEIGLTSESPVANDDGTVKPLWTTYMGLARCALTAALSDKQAGEVKALPLNWATEKKSGFTIHVGRGLGLKYEACIKAYSPGWVVTLGQSDVIFDGAEADEESAKAAAQSDYETRIRSAIVDVPAVEPVGEAGEMPGSNGGFTMAVFKASDVPLGTKLFISPPLSREGEDSAEVYRQALERIANASARGWNVETATEALNTARAIAATALAATRSGSARTAKGCDHE